MASIDGFDEMLRMLLHGDLNGVISHILDMISAELFASMAKNRDYVIQILVVCVLAAFFTNLTNAFGSSLLGDQGFYVAFLMIFTLSVRAFSSFYEIGETMVERAVDTTNVLLPAYMISVTGASGQMSAVAAYELLYLVLGLIQNVILYVMFPLIQVYFLFQFINQMNREQYFTKWITMLSDLISWGLKMICIFVVGMHIIKGLISPMIDAVRVGGIQKTISALPGGSFVAAFTGVLLGCSVLIKNCIGVLGMLILVSVAAVPLIQMSVILVMYKLLSALLEPVIDKRLSKAFAGICDAGTLFIRICFTSVVIVMVSITMIAACTGSHMT